MQRLKWAASTAVLSVMFSGCASTGAKTTASLTNPDPLEQHFGHVLFNDSRQHFPALRPAAPQEARVPGRSDEAKDVADSKANRAAQPLDIARADSVAPRRPLIVPGQGDDDSHSANHAEYTAPRTSARIAKAKTAPARKATPRTTRKTESSDDDSSARVSPRKRARVPAVPKKPKAPKKTGRRVTIEPAAKPAPAETTPAKKGLGDGTRRGELVASARRLIGVETNFDEQGFLIHLLQVADIEVEAESGQDIVKALYDKMNAQNAVYGPSKQPKAGDIIFFSNTYDRDGDGRTDDWFTMAGIVERFDSDGTVQFIGFAKGQIERMYMNAARPSAARNETNGKTLNSVLREKKLSDRPFTLYHAGELFASYGAVE